MSHTDHQKRDDRAVKAYFNQWHVYDLIVQHDYMAHRGIHDALRTTLAASRSTPFSILDLGCGDGSKISQTLRDFPVTHYIGIDLSAVALDQAKTHFAGSKFDHHLVESEFGEYLTDPKTKPVDVIIAGFAVHHLTHEEKPDFFVRCSKKLLPGGELFLYDILCRPGESREQCLVGYCQMLDKTWTALSHDARHSTQDHIRTCDFPVTYETLSEHARNAGFSPPPDPVYADAAAFHCLCYFRR